jgi:hypothetical protein
MKRTVNARNKGKNTVKLTLCIFVSHKLKLTKQKHKLSFTEFIGGQL